MEHYFDYYVFLVVLNSESVHFQLYVFLVLFLLFCLLLLLFPSLFCPVLILSCGIAPRATTVAAAQFPGTQGIETKGMLLPKILPCLDLFSRNLDEIYMSRFASQSKTTSWLLVLSCQLEI